MNELRRRFILFAAAIAVIVIVILLFTVPFIVTQTEQALVLSFGQPVRLVEHPGLSFKQPWQSTITYDRRLLDYEPPAEEVIAADQKRLVVDAYCRFKIVNPLLFYQTMGTELVARTRLNSDYQRFPAPRHRWRRAASGRVVAARRDHASDSRSGERRRLKASASMSSMCGFAAPICRRRTPRRFTSA